MDTTIIDQQSRLAQLQAATRDLLNTLPEDERLRIMEDLQAFGQASDYLVEVFVAQLEALLHDYGIEV